LGRIIPYVTNTTNATRRTTMADRFLIFRNDGVPEALCCVIADGGEYDAQAQFLRLRREPVGRDARVLRVGRRGAAAVLRRRC
jgi:hypothetical protein